MSGTNFKRMLGAGWKNFIRGGAVSVATVVVMTVTLAIIGGLLFVSALLSFSLDLIRDQIGIAVYFEAAASEQEILALKEKIEAFPQVKSVSYTSREQALLDFRLLHENDQIILQGLNYLEDNPLSAYLLVKAKDPSQYESIVATLSTTPALSTGGTSIVSDNNYEKYRKAIDRLSSAIGGTRDVGLTAILLFSLASILIAFATIRLAIYTAKDEIGVMRLVGASNAYIRGPFIVAGFITGILATVLVLLLLFPLALYGSAKSASWLGGFDLFDYYLDNFFMIALILLGSGIFLGGAASILAIRRYLKV